MTLDVDLLKRARELVDSGERVDLKELSDVVMRMWESACDCSVEHQDALAVFENGVRIAAQAGSVTCDQLAAFRVALNDLMRSRLSRGDVEVLRARFLRKGFSPLAFIEESDEPEEIRELRRIVEEVEAPVCVEFTTS